MTRLVTLKKKTALFIGTALRSSIGSSNLIAVFAFRDDYTFRMLNQSELNKNVNNYKDVNLLQKPFVIRDATIEDLPIIIDIYNSTISSRMVTADLEEVTVESRMDWFLDHSPNFRPLWVVLSDDNICAWLSFQSFYGRPAYNDTAEISIYIHEQFRNKGLGKYMLEKALEACPQLHINNLLGFIFAHNKPSVLLFKHYDFEEWGYLPKVAVMDGIERDLIILGKRIES